METPRAGLGRLKGRWQGMLALVVLTVLVVWTGGAPRAHSGTRSVETGPEPFPPGVISTPADELGITFTPDGGTAFFTVRSPTTNTPPLLVIVVSRRLSHGDGERWSEPRIAPFSGRFNDWSPTISPEGSRLFFTSDRPLPGSPAATPPGARDSHLWVVERRLPDGRWGEPRSLGKSIETDAADQNSSVAANGTLYFSSLRAGGKGGFDLYRSRWTNGHYGAPENLADLNTEANEVQPAIARDESFLVFTAVGRPDAIHGGGHLYPRSDLYISFRTAGGGFTPPRNLGSPINTAAGESNPSLSPDGRWLFFTSERSPFRVPMPHPLTANELAAALLSLENGAGHLYRVATSRLPSSAEAPTGPTIPTLPEAELAPLALDAEPTPASPTISTIPAPVSGPAPYAVGPLPEPRIFGEGVLSTPADEFGGALTPDGRTIYFNRSIPRSQLYTILVSSFADGRWSAPEVASFSGTWRDFDPVLAPDGSRLYFVSDRPLAGEPASDYKAEDNGEYNAWFLERTPGGGWARPQPLGEPINGTGSTHFVSATQGGTLYFTSTRPGNRGWADVYRTRRVDGRYLPAENLGDAINRPEWANLEAIVAPDESFLIVSATGHADGYGDSDLYISLRRDGRWLPLRNLGPQVNSAARDYSPRLSPDGRYLFFASERGLPTGRRPRTYGDLVRAIRGVRNGLGNLYQVDLDAEARLRRSCRSPLHKSLYILF